MKSQRARASRLRAWRYRKKSLPSPSLPRANTSVPSSKDLFTESVRRYCLAYLRLYTVSLTHTDYNVVRRHAQLSSALN